MKGRGGGRVDKDAKMGSPEYKLCWEETEERGARRKVVGMMLVPDWLP